METDLVKSLMERKANEMSNYRLESLRLPRDLSLGGTKPRKTVFGGNINVVRRNKQKDKSADKKKEPVKKEKLKPYQPKKKGLDSSRFKQSEGIFSEGSAVEKKARGPFGRPRQESSSSSYLVKPVYKKNDCFPEGDDEEMDDDKFGKFGIKLENFNTWDFVPENNWDFFNVEEKMYNSYFCKMEESEAKTRLGLIKFPDSLAGKVLSDDPKASNVKDYHLGMMTEGKIGTLQITRSGKIYMKIGKIRYLMESMDGTSGPETVASYISPSNEGEKGEIAILGDVEGRFYLTPEWTNV